VGDARETLTELGELLAGYSRCRLSRRSQRLHDEWDAEVQRIYDIRLSPLPSQGELIGVINELSGPRRHHAQRGRLDARRPAQALAHDAPQELPPGIWQQCMGYEIAGGLGAKLAAPEREVFVIIGDGTWLMLSSELVTAVQEGVKLIVLLWDNSGFKSIGSLSRSLGLEGFGTRFIERAGRHAGGRRRRRCGARRCRSTLP
jgi:3D-(3,5/4)-trihydroxycyclohexane-1,2-dione acylhydrolase (decyclizing)